MISPVSGVRMGRTTAYRPITGCQPRAPLLNTQTPRKLACYAAYLDASDSESEAGIGHAGDLHRAASVLPELENWTDDEGLLPVRHPGSFPNAGTSLSAQRRYNAVIVTFEYTQPFARIHWQFTNA